VKASAPVAVSSFVVCAAIAVIVGGSFTAVTVRRNVVEVVTVPSLADTVIVDVPARFAAGVTVTVRLAPLPPNTTLALGTSVVFDELPDTVRLPAAVSTSPTVNAIAPVAVSSVVPCAAIAVIVGASLTAVTVSRNVVGVVVVPSPTVTVIVDEPAWFAAGVTVTVRLAPLPPNTTFAFGTTVVSDEVADTVRLAAAVSTSPTVTASAPVAVSSFVVCAAIAVMVGASFTAVTVSTNVVGVEVVPSPTDTVIVDVPD
jgi:hypothetical protein